MKLAARRRLRLTLRDLAAAAAFASVALSGALPAWVSVCFVLALVASLLGRRPLARQRLWAVVALLVVAAVLFGLALRGAVDLVVAAVSFAGLVTAHRLVSEPSAATDQQALLASLLLIAGAAALSGEIWFALCLLLFGGFACLHLGLAAIEGPTERDEDLPVRPVLRQVSLGVALALVGGIAFFILFPRLSWNVAALRTGAPLFGNTTGMSDRVRLGGGGDIKTSARVVLRARLEPDPGRDRLDQYWIGRRFDVFDGHEWHGSGVDRPPQPMVRLAEVSGRSTTQRIELLPAYGARTAVALQHPALFSQAAALTAAGPFPTGFVYAVGEEVRLAADGNGYTYTAISMRGTWMHDDDDERARALVTDHVDPKVVELTRTVVGSEVDPRRIASRLEQYLKTTYTYTLELEGDVADPLSEFLFVRKAGHCEHFASALALMLRAAKVPARVAVGFYGGERMLNRYVVRAGDAHAWVEAWIDDQGWVTFDATPESGRGSQPPAFFAALTDAFERVQEFWRARIVDYSLLDQVDFARRLVRPPQGQLEGQRSDNGAPAKRPAPLRVAGAALAALAVFLVLRRVTRRGPKSHPAATFLGQLEARLDAAKVQRRADEGIEEVARRLTGEAHPLAAAVQRATRRYLEARFGDRPLSPAESAELLAALKPSPADAARRAAP